MNKSIFSWGIVIATVAISAILMGCSEAIGQPSIEPAPETERNYSPEPINLDREQPVTTTPASPDIARATSDISETKQNDLANDQVKRETRALWSWTSQTAVSKDDIDELLAKVDGARLNVILLGVYDDGEAFFEPSHTRFPNSRERLTNQSPFAEAGYHDALGYLLAIRDKRRSDDDPFNDFEVHAWFTVIEGGDIEKGWPPTDKTKASMLNALFPEFKLKYGAYYLKQDERFVRHDISVIHQPRFRAYMTDLMAGLVEDYDVDGIHLDYIRTGGLICFNNEPLDYPGAKYDYPGCQEDYKAWTRQTYGQEYTLWEDTDGHKEIRDGGSGRVAAWQEQAVGQLVKNIHLEVKAVKPDTIISVASVRNDTSRTSMDQLVNGQVAWTWLDQGWIDAAFVTAYVADTQAVIDKIQKFREAVQSERNRAKVFPGIATYTIGDKNDEWSDLVAEQVDALMYFQWGGQPLDPPAKGVALFQARSFGGAAINALADGPFKEPALPFWGD